jgi:uncharacterized protein
MHRVIHIDIQSTDIERSKAFYSELFGWKMQQWSPDYALFEYPDGSGGGGLSLVAAMPEPCIEIYVEVEDIPAVLAKVVSLGGVVEQEKSEIGGGMGFLGRFRDPCGCLIGIWARG